MRKTLQIRRRNFSLAALAGVSSLTGAVRTLLAMTGAFSVFGNAATKGRPLGGAVTPKLHLSSYRTTKSHLFQPADGNLRAAQINGANPYDPDIYGPTYDYVDFQTGWSWVNPGGDYIDANMVQQGLAAWGSVATPTGSFGTVYDYTMDVKAAVNEATHGSGWLAFKLSPSIAIRMIATPFYGTVGKRPKIAVTYVGGNSATLACRVMAQAASGAATVNSTTPELQLPVFMEFERATDDVATATLSFSITQQHWAGSPTDVKLTGIINPRRGGSQLASRGLASKAGEYDTGLARVSGILGQHRITDRTVIADILIESATLSRSSEANYDPAIWGGVSDTSKFPHAVAGKWFKGPAGQAYATPRIVTSSYKGEGFVPLATGLGAMRVHMPAVAVSAGQEVTNNGRVACDMVLMLPEPLFGITSNIFVRYYVRMGTPANWAPSNRPQVLSNGRPRWTDMAGKTGIGPSHATSYGGVSGSSGGGYGWEMRQSWTDNDSGNDGPDVGGVAQGFHLYDYQTNNPVGHQYGIDRPMQFERWGQLGGHGGVMYAGHWYCVETQLKLNSIDVVNNTYGTDGELRAWIDGRLVYERTGMVFRTAPLYKPAYDGSKLRPARQLGVKELWFNWYHGGQSENTVDRTLFISNLAWGTSYIGPMVQPAPSWKPAVSTAAIIGYAANTHPQGYMATLSELAPQFQPWGTPGTNMPWSGRVENPSSEYSWYTRWAFCGGTWDQTNRRFIDFGGGHQCVCVPAPSAFNLSKLAYEWLDTPLPTDGLRQVYPAAPSQANTAAAYGDKWNAAESLWLGSSTAWGAKRQPGVIQPEVEHSQYALVWIPGAAAGNVNGIVLNCTSPTGAFGGTYDLIQRTYFDLDDYKWKLCASFQRADYGYYAGGACWFGGSVNRAFALQSASSVTKTALQNFDPATKTWYETNATAPVEVFDGGCGFVAHEKSGLLIQFIPSNSAGTLIIGSDTTTGSGAVQFRMKAVDAAAAVAGSHTWGLLAFSNQGGKWPLSKVNLGGGTYRQNCELLGAVYCPRNGKIYIYDWRYNSNTLWVITPPAGCTTPAQYLAGTWTIASETFGGTAVPNVPPSTGAINECAPQVYCRLAWDDVSGCLIGFPPHTTSRVFAIHPAGV